MNFGALGSVIGDIMGVVGTTTAIAEIFLYVEKIKSTGGDLVTEQSLIAG